MTRFAATCCAVCLFACASPRQEPVDATVPDRPDAAADAGGCQSDRECDDGTYCNGIERCEPGAGADDRGCRPSDAARCRDGQTCDENAARCVTSCAVTRDADGDGAAALDCGGDDCDDADPRRYPGAAEICDREDRDEDCDPTTFGYRDLDGDGFPDAACCNVEGERRICGSDCNDAIGIVHPTEAEACDGLDNDCNGAIDDGALQTYWPDRDGDGFGDRNGALVRACSAPAGTAANDRDCDDGNSRRNPSAPEVCDGVDNDCNGALDAIDEDDDRDGYADVRCGGDDCLDIAPPAGCTVADCRSYRAGCSRTQNEYACETVYDSARVHPGAQEVCDGEDWDCDGKGEDDDNDGYLAVGDRCVGGTSSMWPRTDCDDTDRGAFAGAVESCDGVDEDCNGVIDDCVIPNARAMCVEEPHPSVGTIRACRAVACAAGNYQDCDGDLRNSCDDLNTSSRHCGACGRACAFACRNGEACDAAANLSIGAGGGCIATASGALFCRGSQQPTLTRSTLTDVAQVRVVGGGGCARTTAGALWCWGGPPVAVTTLPGPVRDLTSTSGELSTFGSSLGASTCVLAGGELCCWGEAARFVPALRDRTEAAVDVRADRPRCAPTTATDIELGQAGLCALDANGAAQCWSPAEHGLAPPTDARYAAISVGRRHACGIRRADRRIECWGRNGNGQTGAPLPPFGLPTDPFGDGPITPRTTVGTQTALSVVAGSDASCAVWADGTVSCWGYFVQTGTTWSDGTARTYRSHEPYTIPQVTDARSVWIGAGPYMCAVRANGGVQCWGSDGSQLARVRTEAVP